MVFRTILVAIDSSPFDPRNSFRRPQICWSGVLALQFWEFVMKFPSIHSQQVKVTVTHLQTPLVCLFGNRWVLSPFEKRMIFSRKDMGFENSGLWIIAPIFFSGLFVWPLLRKSKRSAQGRPTWNEKMVVGFGFLFSPQENFRSPFFIASLAAR